MPNRFSFPIETILDNNGRPVGGGKLNFYEAGTTTRLDTFSDEGLTIANTNPVVADSAGRFGDIWLREQNYKVVLTDADDITVWSADPVKGTFVVLGDDYSVSQKSPPDMTVAIAAGSFFNTVTGARVVNGLQSTATLVAPAANPRNDIVHLDQQTGIVGVVTGAEAASPVDPAIPAGKLPAARLRLAPSTTAITSSLIDDIRELELLGNRTTNISGDTLQRVFTQTGAVATGTTVIPPDDTIPQITEGDEYMTLAITPKSASSRLRIDVNWNGGHSAVSKIHIVALFRDAGANALASDMESQGVQNGLVNIMFTHNMPSPGTGATTFRVRAGASVAGTTTFNGNAGGRLLGGVMASSITITEYLP